jgi:hypothetical protein
LLVDGHACLANKNKPLLFEKPINTETKYSYPHKKQRGQIEPKDWA